jgi:hypothetical protein
MRCVGFVAISDIDNFLQLLPLKTLAALRQCNRANAAAYRNALPWVFARHILRFLTDPEYARRPSPRQYEEQLLEHYGAEISRGVFIGPPGVPRIKLFTSTRDRAVVRWSFETQTLIYSVEETSKLLGSVFAQHGWKIAGFAYVTEKWHDVLGHGIYAHAHDVYVQPGLAMISVRRKTGCKCSLCLDDSLPCEFPR